MEIVEHTITQSNKLIEASYSLTLNEKRLVLAAASRIDPRKPLPIGKPIRVRADAFASVFNLQLKHSYEALQECAKRLYGRNLRQVAANGSVTSEMRWIYQCDYHAGEGCVDVFFTPEVLKHLTKLHREFTTYQLKQIGGLSSFYAIRLYELCAQFVKIGARYCSIEQLRATLDLGDKYPDVKDLRKRVIDPATKEMNSGTDLLVEVEPVRKGRKIIGFNFNIERNDQLALELPGDAPPEIEGAVAV